MTFYITVTLAFLLSLASSFYGSIAGGASLLSLPGLIFLGIPPEVAVATNNLANLGRFSLSSVKFIRSKKIIWKYVYTLAPLGLLAGFLGARILLEIDRDLVKQSLGIVMLCLVPLGFTKKEFGTVAQAVSQRRFLAGHFVYFAVSIYGAALLIGSGPLILYIVIYFFGLTILQANATSSFCWLFITISALFYRRLCRKPCCSNQRRSVDQAILRSCNFDHGHQTAIFRVIYDYENLPKTSYVLLSSNKFYNFTVDSPLQFRPFYSSKSSFLAQSPEQ